MRREAPEIYFSFGALQSMVVKGPRVHPNFRILVLLHNSTRSTPTRRKAGPVPPADLTTDRRIESEGRQIC